ncbi:hypothetical protein CERSUDRAFT_116565, partial [Gelatoporia subvermispora B]
MPSTFDVFEAMFCHPETVIGLSSIIKFRVSGLRLRAWVLVSAVQTSSEQDQQLLDSLFRPCWPVTCLPGARINCGQWAGLCTLTKATKSKIRCERRKGAGRRRRVAQRTRGRRSDPSGGSTPPGSPNIGRRNGRRPKAATADTTLLGLGPTTNRISWYTTIYHSLLIIIVECDWNRILVLIGTVVQ